jgi:peptidase E
MIDDFFLNKVGKSNPRICLLPTACGDRQDTIERFHSFYQSHSAATSHVSLFSVEIEDMESHLLKQDGIYITGGNTKSMLALWREWGIDHALRKAYRTGVTICGISAGAMCFFEEGFSDSFADQYGTLKCLGFIRGSFCPHYIPGGTRAKVFQDYVRINKMKPGVGLEDGVALYYEDGRLLEVVRSREEAHAYRIKSTGESELIKT